MVADNATSGDAKRPSDSSALTHCRLRSRPFMPKRNRSLGPTGGLSRFTTNWYEFSLRRLYSSTVPWPLPCAMSGGRSGAYRRGVLGPSGKQGELANYYLARSARADMQAGQDG